jgi:hypothetical protein
MSNILKDQLTMSDILNVNAGKIASVAACILDICNVIDKVQASSIFDRNDSVNEAIGDLLDNQIETLIDIINE